MDLRAVKNVGSPGLPCLSWWALEKHFSLNAGPQPPDLISGFLGKRLPSSICVDPDTCLPDKNGNRLAGAHLKLGSLFRAIFLPEKVGDDIGGRISDSIARRAGDNLTSNKGCLVGSRLLARRPKQGSCDRHTNRCKSARDPSAMRQGAHDSTNTSAHLAEGLGIKVNDPIITSASAAAIPKKCCHPHSFAWA